jgi:hypothetical protein
MKKLILTAAITLTAIAGAFAQSTATSTPATTNPGPETATTNLSVTINPIQTIKVNGSGVNLNYATTTDYADGVTEARPDHLTVYSTGAFQVKVSASDLAATGTDEKILSSGITVTAANGTTKPLATLTSSGEVALPNTVEAAATIFQSTQGGVDRNVDVTYHGKGGDAYINKYFKELGSKTVYETVVTYSIESM